MKGNPIIYVPIDPELDGRKRIQKECVEELLLNGWKEQGTIPLRTTDGLVEIHVKVLVGG